MVLDPSILTDTSTQLNGGAFRPSSPPAIAARSHPATAVIPLGSLSRYVELAQVGTRDDLYDSASLFMSAADAHAAYDNLVRSNAALRLSAFPLGVIPTSLQRLTSADAVRAWQLGHETVLVALWQNVVIVLALRGPDPGRCRRRPICSSPPCPPGSTPRGRRWWTRPIPRCTSPG